MLFLSCVDTYALKWVVLRRLVINQQLAKQSVVINLNTATEGELTQLKGIGSSKAQKIVLYREAFGAFGSVDDLANVKGIGAKTVAKNRVRMSVE